MKRFLFIIGLFCCTFLLFSGLLEGVSLSAERKKITPFLKHADKSMKKAKAWVEKGDYQKALDELRPYISRPARYPDHYSDYVVILFWSGNAKEAISRFESMPNQVPRRPYLLRNMATAYYGEKNFIKAASLYRETLQYAPNDIGAMEGLVNSHFADGRFQSAKSHLERLIKKNPGSLQLRLLHPVILIKQEKYLDALDSYERLIDRFPKNIRAIETKRDDTILSLPEEQKIALISILDDEAMSGKQDAARNLMLFQARFNNYNDAVKAYESLEIKVENLSDHKLFWLAWAHFKAAMTDSALSLFEILNKRGTYELLSKTGLAYCLADKAKFVKAHELIDNIEPRYPENLQILYTRAYVYEKAKRFWDAIEKYDEILSITPDNMDAERFRLRTFSDMGASYFAYENARETFPYDTTFHDGFLRDSGLDNVKWMEPEEGVRLFESFLGSKSDSRYIFDYIVALTGAKHHESAVVIYKGLRDRNIEPPLWLHEQVAEAYLYLEEPKKALEHYNKTLEAFPDSYTALFGKFYTLQELRQWREAKALLSEMKEIFPKMISHEYNPQQMEMDIARGWLLTYEDRLRDADNYFQTLYTMAPGNIQVRNGLAHVHLWRGWNRMALGEFNIMDSMDPEYIYGKPGKYVALNSLANKERSRVGAEKLHEVYPRNKRFNKLIRTFEIEQMNEFYARFESSIEEDETYDMLFETGTSTSLSLYTRLFGFFLYRRTWIDNPTEERQALGDDVPTYFKRAGMGIDHIFNSRWNVRQQFSVNYDDGGDFGSFTRITFTPNDYWHIAASYDSFAFDLPKRARAFDVEAEKAAWDITYRESEWRQYGLSGSRQWFSDNNIRDEVILGYEQNLWLKNDWRNRIFTDLYYSRNSEHDDPGISYYNPESAWGISITNMTEQVVKNLYERVFFHRIYLTLGTYDQQNYSLAPVGSVRYEQEHNFTDTHYLLWGIGVGRNVYDGDAVNALNFDIMYVWRF